MQVAVYTRVSTDEQTTASQDAEIERWLEKEGITDFAIYCDHGESGSHMGRPEMRRLLTDIADGKVQKVLIWRMDRLGRTASGLTTLFEELTRHNVTLISIRDHFDLNTPSGRLMANVLASVAQFETEVRRERQAAGIRVAKEKKVYRGRRKGSIEHRNGPARALKMKLRGLSSTEIAKAIGCSKRTVWNYLEQAGYKPGMLQGQEEQG